MFREGSLWGRTLAKLGYYIIEDQRPDGWQLAGLWYFDGQKLAPVTDCLTSTFPVRPGESLHNAVETAIRQLHSQITPFRITPTNFKPGEYYPRIARPTLSQGGMGQIMLPNRSDLQNEIIASKGYFRTLIELLERILLVVHPDKGTLSTYGYEIRNLLILACTECEAQWRSVLSANGHSASKKDYNTADFVRLAQPMKLRDYVIKFARYPWLGDFQPFEHWSIQSPTKSMIWYDAYNASKHDRITNLHESTLANAMMALGACWLMLITQFGGPVMGDHEHIREYFTLVRKPSWSLEDAYIFNVIGQHHRAWHAVNCPF